MNDVELKNIISLFDDPDAEVAKLIDLKMLSEKRGIIGQLSQAYMSEHSPQIRSAILRKQSFLEREYAISDLKESLSYEYPDLFKALFLLNKIVDPKLKYDSFYASITGYLQQFYKEINEDQTAMEKIGIFNEIFFKRNHFKTTDFFYTDIKNIYIPDVMKGSQGSPVAIAVLYLFLAKEVGLSVMPLCFHSGFIYTYVEEEEILFYINVFRDGEIFFEESLRSYIEEYGLEYHSEEFALREDKVLLTIYAEMLHFLYMNNSNSNMSDIMERVLELFGNERFMIMEEDDEDY